MPERLRNQGFKLVALFVGLWLIFDIVAHLVAEVLWFEEVRYLPAFLLRLTTQLGVWALASILTAVFLLGNLTLAKRLRYPHDIVDKLHKESFQSFGIPTAPRTPGGTVPQSLRGERQRDMAVAWEAQQGINLRSLFPIVLVLGVILGIMLLYYANVGIRFWQPNVTVASLKTGLPSPFQPTSVWQVLQQPIPQIPKSLGEFFQNPPGLILQGIILVLIVMAVLFETQFLLTAIAVALSIFFGFVLFANWDRILLFFHPAPFNSVDPLFNQDISFYIFSLPILQLLDFWLGGVILYSLLAVTLIYLLSGDSISRGKFLGFASAQLRHLYGLGGLFMLAMAFRYWLARYQLLYSPRGVAYGASYTDVAVELPVNTVLSILAIAIALLLIGKILFARFPQRNGRLLYLGLGLFILLAVTGHNVLPTAIQRLVVQPNELVRERPYIERSIALTRQAFGLNDIEVQTFDPQGELTFNTLQENDLTVENIRLWDKRPLLQTNRQLQQIRLYYEFPDADIDRYTLRVEPTSPPNGDTQKQQVLIAARELNYTAVPEEAQTWVNKHLIYTHGYGFTLSPVNTVGPGGLPDYFVQDIGTGVGDEGALRTSSEAIRDSIPIGKPRIYYGEITDTYVMTPTNARELDYPSGEENVYNVYDGTGGVSIASGWRRLLFAEYLKDFQMLLTRDFTPETKVLFRRNIRERISAIAPFLQFDRDPYLVAAEGYPQREQPNYLYWIVDAYTTSDRYPYSDPGQYPFNYIRNSVKIVIDAYNGAVDFYVADPTDPIIRSWTSIFPEMFKPLEAMPPNLLSHIRYPLDFFSTQSERLLTYHMTDPQVFYNREDQWRIPLEIYADEPRSVEPYFLIMRLPTAEAEEYILLSPFTPSQRNNLIAWLAARSDSPNYGRLLLYQFPKQQLVYGPEQIEARINQDPVISQQISLWNRRGSRAIQGNLLVIPIEQSLLYVEPVYLEAEQASLPTLARVIVVYENRIVMAETLEQSLQAIFQPEQTPTPPIIRPIEETLDP